MRDFIATPPPWLRVVAPSSSEIIPGLAGGETAAIVLAVEVQAGRLIIDEYRGRKVAAQRGLSVVGTIGVLELAAELGLIDLKEAFARIEKDRFLDQPQISGRSRLALFAQTQAGRNQTDWADRPSPPA